jgi:uncharacterized protein
MQVKVHPLISPAVGTSRSITSFHFGPGGGEKIYIQSSLHADELPGMLVSWHLRRKLTALEQAGKLRGEIVLVPVANPIGLNQHMDGHLHGRFELDSSQNFNRNFLDFAPLVGPRIEGKLTGDPIANRDLIRRTMGEILAEQHPTTELVSLRTALQRMSYDADIVLDLHCDWDAAMHLYTNPDTWDQVEPLARYIGAQASLLALNSVGDPFDEVHSFCWSALRERFGIQYPIPYGAVSVTVELRGQPDVSHELNEADADAIVAFLTHRGVIDNSAPALPALPYPATPLAGAEPIEAPVSGVIAFRAAVGTWIHAGDVIAEVIDPIADSVTVLRAQTSGVLYARHISRFATAGMTIARVAGAKPYRTGQLLSP